MKPTPLSVAEEVQQEWIQYYCDVDDPHEDDPCVAEIFQAECLQASKDLKKRLEKYGYAAILRMGAFTIDFPDSSYYEDGGEEDGAEYIPLHYWVEVNGHVLDIALKQFQDECDEELPDIYYEPIKDALNWRYSYPS